MGKLIGEFPEPNRKDKVTRFPFVSYARQLGLLANTLGSHLKGNIRHQKLRNCCVSKKLMSHIFFVKFRVFRREFLQNHWVYRAQIFRNYYALSIFRVLILLASSVVISIC